MIRKSTACLAIFSIFCLSITAEAQGINAMRAVAESGDWELRKGTDNFTDTVSCVIVNKGNLKAQITSSTLYFSGGRGNGGLGGYRLRFDDSPPQDLRLATKIEKDIGSAVIEGSEFRKATASSRVRFQAVGILSGSGFHHDVQMAGVPELLIEWTTNNCPD